MLSFFSVVAFGQKRALVVWQRIMFPDGSSLRIDNVPATDASGYAGLQDKVDFHTWALLKDVALATLLGAGSEVTVTGESDLVLAIRESTQQNVSRAGDQLTSHNLNIQPTITIRPGATARLELKLAKLPDRKPIKLAITVTPDLHAALTEYVAVYKQTEEPLAELVPHMLAAFLASDRGFAKAREALSGSAS